MNTQSPSFYQRVIDKTKGLAFQSQFIAQNVDKRRAALMQANPNAMVSEGANSRCWLMRYWVIFFQIPPKLQVKRWGT